MNDRRAQLNLEAQAYEAYSPRCRVRGRVQALFPGYKFIRYVERWRSVAGTRGVSRLIMNGELPSLVPAVEVERLRAREGADGLIALEPPFKAGQAVRFEAGGFDGLAAVYDGQSGAERCYVLMEMLGRAVRLQVREAHLAAA